MIKLSNGVELSEATVISALKAKGICVEKPKKTNGEVYPMASVHYSTGIPSRLILNLPNKYLDEEYKGYVISIEANGNLGVQFHKESPDGGKEQHYSHEREVFPNHTIPPKK